MNSAPSASQELHSSRRYRIGNNTIDLENHVLVAGIVNVTPDSFSDGGQCLDPSAAISHAENLIADGADILDIGAESTRPGAEPVTAEEEIGRLRPVLESLCKHSPVPISVDTSKPEVAEAVLHLGASILNDVTGLRLRDEDGLPILAKLAAAHDASLIIMHMLGEPRSMQSEPHYDDVVSEVGDYLSEAAEKATVCGVAQDRIAVDPGIGFGKTLAHNLQLLVELEQLAGRGYPVMIGVSRKSMFKTLFDLAVEDRLEASLAAAVASVMRGARLVRVHDVRETVRAVRFAEGVITKD